MNQEPDPKLDAFIHAKLRELPDVPAPATLNSRVLAAIQVQAAAWWRRAWWQWPLAAKVAFLLVAAAAAGAISSGGFFLERSVNTYSQQVMEKLPQASGLGFNLGTLTDQAWQQISTASQPVLWGLLALVAATYLFCIGVGSALYRFAFKRFQQP